MASARSHSPIELPPRSQKTTVWRPKAAVANATPVARLPVSCGVLWLGIAVTWIVGLMLGGFLLREAEQNAAAGKRALERRLAEQLAQLARSTSTLEAEQDLFLHRHAEQSAQIERVTAEAEALRGRVHSGRARRRERR